VYLSADCGAQRVHAGTCAESIMDYDAAWTGKSCFDGTTRESRNGTRPPLP